MTIESVVARIFGTEKMRVEKIVSPITMRKLILFKDIMIIPQIDINKLSVE